MQIPKFSFVVPVYNSQAYVAPCMESIIGSAKQVDVDIEIILIDDGSEDSGFDIMRKYSEEYSFVKAIQKTNTGVSATRNLGLEYATGEYVCFIDCDDLIHCDYLKLLSNVINDFLPDMIQIGFERRAEVSLYSICPKRSYLYTNVNAYFQNEVYTHAVWSYVFKRAIISENAIAFDQQLRYSEDQDFILKFFAHVKSLATIDKVLYVYNDVPTSAVKKSSFDMQSGRNRALAQLAVIKNLFKYLSEFQSYHDIVVSDLIDDYFLYAKRVSGYKVDDIFMDYAYFVDEQAIEIDLNNSPFKNLLYPIRFRWLYFNGLKLKIKLKKKKRKLEMAISRYFL